MNLDIGFATSIKSSDATQLEKKLDKMLVISDAAIEISLTRGEKMKHDWTDTLLSLVKKFQYRSLHAPVFYLDRDDLRYAPSDAQAEHLLKTIDFLVDQANMDTVLFHPDIVDDFQFLEERYGSKLAFENMDDQKQFGKTVKDMEYVFHQAPSAKWVCDVNHIYTNDRSMESTFDFHCRFKQRLTHYHVSAYGGWHDSFTNLDNPEEEKIILSGIVDTSLPLIHEGNAFEKGVAEKEIEFFYRHIKK